MNQPPIEKKTILSHEKRILKKKIFIAEDISGAVNVHWDAVTLPCNHWKYEYKPLQLLM